MTEEEMEMKVKKLEYEKRRIKEEIEQDRNRLKEIDYELDDLLNALYRGME